MNKIIIGCDVSKAHLDFVVFFGGEAILHYKIRNTPKAIKAWIKLLAKENDIHIGNCLVCMEHTGVYNNHLLNTLVTTQAVIVVESGARIKLSLGLQRGKNDKLDAKRIAEYAFRFGDKLKIWKPKRDVIIQLKNLSSQRDRLVKVKKMLEVPIKEAKLFESKQTVKALEDNAKNVLDELKSAIKEIKLQIRQIIQQDQHLKQLSDQITSVKGYGEVIATEIIITTNEFKDFDSHKKYACHAGVAPFEHSSGSSIKGRSRVSHKANKNLKTLLHLGAMSAIRGSGTIQEYYNRKVSEGKNKMKVLNAVRNKMIRIVFALIKNNTMYENNYHLNLD